MQKDESDSYWLGYSVRGNAKTGKTFTESVKILPCLLTVSGRFALAVMGAARLNLPRRVSAARSGRRLICAPLAHGALLKKAGENFHFCLLTALSTGNPEGAGSSDC